MRGIFERPPGSEDWWIRYALANGKIRREKAGTKSAAINLYRKRKTQVLEGKKLPENLRKRAVTFQEIAEDVRAYSGTKHRERTQYIIGRQVLKLVAHFGDTSAENIQPQEIMTFLAKNTKTKATYNRYRSLLSLTYRWAMENGKVSTNPLRNVPRHRNEDNKRERFLTGEEESRLRGKIREHWPEDEPIFDLYLHTGLRGGNLFDLRWKDVDLDAGLLTVPRSKSGEELHIEINSAARRALEILARHRSDDRVCPCTYRPFVKRFKEVLLLARIEGFRPHDLRHTFGSRLVMGGVDLRTVQEFMGHKDITTTLRYAHLNQAHRREAIERLVALGGKPEPVAVKA